MGSDTGNPIAGGTVDETETAVSGILTDSLGQPVTACSVWVRPLPSLSSNATLAKLTALASELPSEFLLITDANGAFNFSGLPVGKYALVAIDLERKIGGLQTFELQAGDSLVWSAPLVLSPLQGLPLPLGSEWNGLTITIAELGLTMEFANDSMYLYNIPAGNYTVTSPSKPYETVTIPAMPMPPASASISWNAAKTLGTVLDNRDDSIYRVVPMADLAWFAVNAAYATPNSACNPNDPYALTSCRGYGRFYTHAEALSLACPAGWRLPTLSEWQNMTNLAGGDLLAGSGLKSTTGWDANGGSNGQDLYGLNILPAGSATSPALGTEAYFWTATEATTGLAHIVNFSAGEMGVFYSSMDNSSERLSVRCVTPL